ncbi:MAG: hypothetical protein L3J22_10150 [Xanthomonadales bacterium]|nr:hypothetical protein [Xanthomonadales bacterium]
MKKSLGFFIIALMLPAISSASSLDGYKQTVIDSLSRFEETDRDQWSFSVERIQRSGATTKTSVESFNPSVNLGNSKASPWSLLKENKKTPDEKRLASYQKQMSKREEERKANKEKAAEDGGSKDVLIAMIKLDSLEITQQEDHQVILSFTPLVEDMDEESLEYLAGEIIIDTNNNYVSQVKIKNIGKLTPAFSVTLKKFLLLFEFIKIEEHILPLNIVSEISGKVAFMKSIKEYSSDSYSDYRYLDTEYVIPPEG